MSLKHRRQEFDTAQEQAKVDAWNNKYPVGTPVAVRKDRGEVFDTTTRSHAQVLGNHTAVIWVIGIAGAYSLDRVEPLNQNA